MEQERVQGRLPEPWPEEPVSPLELSEPEPIPALNPHYPRGFVTKPLRRHARRARGVARERGILETVC